MSDYDEAYKKSVEILHLSRKSENAALLGLAETINITLSLNNVMYSEAALKQLDMLIVRATEIENTLVPQLDATKNSLTEIRYTALSMITHIQTYTKKEAPALYKLLEQKIAPKIKP